jgi:hypothetical protein
MQENWIGKAKVCVSFPPTITDAAGQLISGGKMYVFTTRRHHHGRDLLRWRLSTSHASRTGRSSLTSGGYHRRMQVQPLTEDRLATRGQPPAFVRHR